MRAIGQLGMIACVAACMVGCGGGGGAPVVPIPPVSARAASIAGAQAAVTYQGIEPGISNTANNQLSSGVKRLNTLAHVYAKVAELATRARTSRSMSRDWQYDPTTDTYYWVDDTTDSSGVDETIYLSSDGTTDNEGDVYVSLTPDTSQPTEYTVSLVFNVVMAGNKITGTLTMTGADPSDFEVTGTLSTGVSGQITLDLVESNGSISGTMAASGVATKVSLTNLKTSTKSNQLTASFTDGNTPGTVIVNADGSGSSTATDDTGVWTLTWDNKQSATLTAPSGQTSTGNLTTIS